MLLGLSSVCCLRASSTASGELLRYHWAGHGHALAPALQLAVGLLGGTGWSARRAVGWAAVGCIFALARVVCSANTFFRSDTSHVVTTKGMAQELSRVAVHKADPHFTYFFSGSYDNSILMSNPSSGWAAQKR